MRKAKQLKGVWVCSNCGNIEIQESEVMCWKCGTGEMHYWRGERIASLGEGMVSKVKAFLVALGQAFPCSEWAGPHCLSVQEAAGVGEAPNHFELVLKINPAGSNTGPQLFFDDHDLDMPAHEAVERIVNILSQNVTL